MCPPAAHSPSPDAGASSDSVLLIPQDSPSGPRPSVVSASHPHYDLSFPSLWFLTSWDSKDTGQGSQMFPAQDKGAMACWEPASSADSITCTGFWLAGAQALSELSRGQTR